MNVYTTAAIRGLTDLGNPQSVNQDALVRHFGEVTDDLLPLWIAEPYLPLARPIVDVVRGRADDGWFGYEARPQETHDAFRAWLLRRHGWDIDADQLVVSPSVGTSIAALLSIVTEDGEGVVLQPPVFTDFKPIVRNSDRVPITNPLVMSDGRYGMDLAHLESVASDDSVNAMILCNPHNPVGRVWTAEELRAVAVICERNGVTVIADEIHADIALRDATFTPFGAAAEGTGVRWAATHGPLKTFGLAGIADSYLISDDEDLLAQFRSLSSRLHLTRNNVVALAATRAAYEDGAEWLDGFIAQVTDNAAALAAQLPEQLRLIKPEGTYLAWIDMRALEIPVPELGRWLAQRAGIAASPGHWFGREGAGFARVTIAVNAETVSEIARRLTEAVNQA